MHGQVELLVLEILRPTGQGRDGQGRKVAPQSVVAGLNLSPPALAAVFKLSGFLKEFLSES